VTGVTPRGRPRIAALKPTGEREVAVDAESLSYDQATNTLTARGGVTVRREDTTLTADEVVYDRTNGIVEARGHVVLTEPQATVEGDFAHLDLEAETGWVENADATLEVSRYLLRAGRIDKQGGPKYSIARGVFTTCECGGLEKPSWSLAGGRTDVDLQGAGRARDMTFRVKDVPVFYFPYLIFPANTQRQTGLLIRASDTRTGAASSTSSPSSGRSTRAWTPRSRSTSRPKRASASRASSATRSPSRAWDVRLRLLQRGDPRAIARVRGPDNQPADIPRTGSRSPAPHVAVLREEQVLPRHARGQRLLPA
jgi:hypothetical protein